MSQKPGVSDRYRMASPWPLFVALGFVLTEVGIVLGVFPVAVGGVMLFGGSVAGILTESDYVSHLWKATATIGVALSILGVVLVGLQGQFGIDVSLAAIDEPNVAGHRLLSRGLALTAAGVILVATGIVGQLGDLSTR